VRLAVNHDGLMVPGFSSAVRLCQNYPGGLRQNYLTRDLPVSAARCDIAFLKLAFFFARIGRSDLKLVFSVLKLENVLAGRVLPFQKEK